MSEASYARRYARFVLRHRRLVVFSLFALTLFAALFIGQINLRNDPDSLLPLSNRYIATNFYAEETYGMGNIMVWGLKVKDGDIYKPWFLRLVKQFYDDVSELPYANPENFAGLASPRMRNIGVSEEGGLEFVRLIPTGGLSDDPQEAQRQVDFAREGLEKHLVLEPLLAYFEDADGQKCELLDAQGLITNESVARAHKHCAARGTFIIGDFGNGMKEDHIAWIGTVQALMEKYQTAYGDRVEFFISGEPYFLATMVQELRNKAWLFGVSLVIVFLLLWYEFRFWICAVLPLLGVAMTIVLTLGLMGMTHFKLTTMMALTPVLLLAIGTGHAMQVTRRFMQELHACRDPEAAAEEAIRHTIVPAALSIGTDLHGFFAISFVDISFYKAYAYFGIFGMSTLILTTTTLIPLMMLVLPPKVCDVEAERRWQRNLAGRMARMLTGLASGFRWGWWCWCCGPLPTMPACHRVSVP